MEKRNCFNPRAYVGVRAFGERCRMMPDKIAELQAQASNDCAPSDALFPLSRGGWMTADQLHPDHPIRVEYERARAKMTERNQWIVRSARALRNG